MASLSPPPITRSLAYTRIAFASKRAGHWGHLEIYLINPDGAGRIQLTNNADWSWSPAWSPDGEKIVYLFGDPHPQVYVMNADGTNPTPMTNDTANHRMPAWSPDGQQIVWSCYHTGSPAAIYVMNADGTDRRRLSRTSNSDWMPAWSPDGAKIAFTSSRDGHQEIYVMNADGTNPTPLTCTAGGGSDSPAWSPNGAKIAFTSSRDGNKEVYVMNADGTNPTRLTCTAGGESGNPSWSPDGAKIAFTSSRDGDQEIYVMNADGTNPTRLTYDTAKKSRPDWSPFLSQLMPDMLLFTDVFAPPGAQALMAVRLHTNQPLSRLQFMVQPIAGGVPTGIARFAGLINNLAYEGWTATFATDQEGITPVLLFNPNNTSLPPGWHTVLHLAYDISPDAVAGTEIHLKVIDDVFSAPSRAVISHTLEGGMISVGRPGDLTGGPLELGDGQIDARDIHAVVDILTGKRPSPKYGALAFYLTDVNGDGVIDILDVVEIENLSLGGVLKRHTDRPSAPVGIGLGPVIRLESGQPALTVMLASDSILAGLQMVITYTATQLQVEPPRAVGQAARMEVGYHITQEPTTGPAPLSTLRIVLYSCTGQLIGPRHGTILIIPVTVLREPSLIFLQDLVELRNVTRGSTCQAEYIPLKPIEADRLPVSALPFRTALITAHGNSFRGATQILYELASPEHVTISIHTLHGEEIVRLVDAPQGPGRYGVRWYGRNRHGDQVPPGDYLCRMTTSAGVTEIPLKRL